MRRRVFALLAVSLGCLLAVRPTVAQEGEKKEGSEPPAGQEAEKPADDEEPQESEGEKGQEEDA